MTIASLDDIRLLVVNALEIFKALYFGILFIVRLWDQISFLVECEVFLLNLHVFPVLHSFLHITAKHHISMLRL